MASCTANLSDKTEDPVSVAPTSDIPVTSLTSSSVVSNGSAFSCHVSHIPRTVSVSGSVQLPSSTNSSVSSGGQHVMGATTKVGDDETVSVAPEMVFTNRHHVQDSLDESSIGIVGKKRAISRKVSDAEGDDISLVNASSKKRKVVSANQPGTVQSSLRMLGGPEDSKVLNPLHIFVRMQIEVFLATARDMAQPSPGRKNPVRLNQVGLRCIHCKNLPSRDRVKRAVCYPSSVGRVYHSASDMKFDHFPACRGLSVELRQDFETLKGQCKRRGERGGKTHSSTAQYYHDSAHLMGMEDCGNGIFMREDSMSSQLSSAASTSMKNVTSIPTSLHLPAPVCAPRILPQTQMSSPAIAPAPSAQQSPDTSKNVGMHAFNTHLIALAYQQSSLKRSNASNSLNLAQAPLSQQQPTLPNISNNSGFHEMTKFSEPSSSTAGNFRESSALACPLDAQYLNPLHCFVRRHVEVFAATKADLSAPSPGRKNRVHLGQVGIRCTRCAHLALKDRVKRAICYPPSVSGIYHSVSNMKFDHFAACRGLSPDHRAEFAALRANCNRRGGSTSNGARGMSNSTAQYYHDSAIRLGLVDTPDGIRFHEQYSGVTRSNEGSKPVSDGISALMFAATDPTVRAEYERSRSVVSQYVSVISSSRSVEEI